MEVKGMADDTIQEILDQNEKRLLDKLSCLTGKTVESIKGLGVTEIAINFDNGQILRITSGFHGTINYRLRGE